MNKRLSLFLLFAILAIVNSMGLRKQIRIPDRNVPRPATILWATTTMNSKLSISNKGHLIKDVFHTGRWYYLAGTKTELYLSPGSILEFSESDESCDFGVEAKITLMNYKGDIQEYKSGEDWVCNDKKAYVTVSMSASFYGTRDIYQISGRTCNDRCTFTIPLE